MSDYLQNIEQSERLISDLYIDLRRRINSWASLTKQTAQARMGYVGQHLVSIATGYPGGRSGARGKDLVISDSEYGEIKTCYRVDQLGKCNTCGAVVASIEQECPVCDSPDLKRNDDSKWLISIRHDNEYALIIEPKYYYLVLFDFTDLKDPHTIRASIWEVDTKRPGFAFCLIDYYENIRSKSKSKAPFNLWPFQMKFELMCPRLIYRSYIYEDDRIFTETFPGRDAYVPVEAFNIKNYSRSKNLTLSKLENFAGALGIGTVGLDNKRGLIDRIQAEMCLLDIEAEDALNLLAFHLYWPDVSNCIFSLPEQLQRQLREAGLVD